MLRVRVPWEAFAEKSKLEVRQVHALKVEGSSPSSAMTVRTYAHMATLPNHSIVFLCGTTEKK